MKKIRELWRASIPACFFTPFFLTSQFENYKTVGVFMFINVVAYFFTRDIEQEKAIAKLQEHLKK